MTRVSNNASTLPFPRIEFCYWVTLVNDEIYWTGRCAKEHALDKVLKLLQHTGLELSFRQLFFRLYRNSQSSRKRPLTFPPRAGTPFLQLNDEDNVILVGDTELKQGAIRGPEPTGSWVNSTTIQPLRPNRVTYFEVFCDTLYSLSSLFI